MAAVFDRTKFGSRERRSDSSLPTAPAKPQKNTESKAHQNIKTIAKKHSPGGGGGG